MIFINTLRMLADLSVYFFFAELFVVGAGHESQLFHLMILSLCYGILVYLQTRNFHKLYMLLPVMVLFLPGRHVLALIPPILYILYLIWKENTGLSWDRQSELFSMSWKVFMIAGACICLSGNYANFVQYSLPMAFLSIVTSVLLMRMLRHDSATYLSPHYQLKNCMVLIIILVLAWLFSRDFVFELLGNTIKTFYLKGIYPILTFFVMCFVFLLELIMKIFSWIKLGEIRFKESQLPESEGAPTYKDFSTALGEHVSSFESVLTMLIILALLITAFFFFRWLALHRGEESFISHGLDIIRNTDSVATKKERATSTVLQVRKQYRIFLKLYRDHGGRLEICSTSEDVLRHSSKILPNESQHILEEMRSIYLQARYHNAATKTDLKRMKQINKELSRDMLPL